MQSETETAIMMQTHLQQLERPYPIISYGKEVAMQTGTLIVVEPSPDGNDVVTHSHPVVSYANREKVKLDPKSGRYIPDGVVWDKVEVGRVTTLCTEREDHLSWYTFERMVGVRLFISTTEEDVTDAGYAKSLARRFADLGIKIQLPPTEGTYDIVLNLENSDNPNELIVHGHSMEVEGFGNNEVLAIANSFPLYAKAKDKEELYEVLRTEVEAYLDVIGHDAQFYFSFMDRDFWDVSQRLNNWMGV